MLTFTRVIGQIYQSSSKTRLIALGYCLLLASCVPTKDVIYMQTAEKDFYGNQMSPYKLKVGDVINVHIISLDKNVAEHLQRNEPIAGQSVQAATQASGDPLYLQGYAVEENGAISIPFVGDAVVQGLSITEAREIIYELVATQLTNFELDVRLGGIRFSTLGEFNRPGKHVVMQHQVSILEALAICGDLTHVANRKEVKIIRKERDGIKIITLNLLDADFLSNQDQFIRSDDIIYVEPLPQKSWGFGITGAQTLSTFLTTLGTSIAMTLSILTLTR